MKDIYLDYASTTCLKPYILKKMMPYLKADYGNASSMHSLGRCSKKAIENARLRISKALNCEKNEIYFTSSATESNNWAIKGIAFKNRYKGNHIITSCIEHSSVIETCKFLEKNGFEITYLPVDEYGSISLDDLKNAIKEETILISIMFANNEIGTMQPIKQIGQLAYEKGIYFHTDATQAIGKISVNILENNIDLLSISGHKIYGPKGIGMLYINSDVDIESFIHGGSQENGRRAGTENTSHCVGLSYAVESAIHLLGVNQQKIKKLEEYFINGIYSNISCLKLNGNTVNKVPGILNFTFQKVHAKTLLLLLDELKIYASSGSACSCGLSKASHVLLEIGLSEKKANESIRFCLSSENTEEDIDFFIKKLSEIITNLRYHLV